MVTNSLVLSLCSSSHSIGEILLKQGKRAEAEVIYRDLLYRSPENYEYYQKLEQCLDLREYSVSCMFSRGNLIFIQPLPISD